ncbi:zinc finger BED domain-containing protein 4-like [Dysidea avara]|uniref:zinc finger BED domain-containing protein 4-like n=1 Tax=Dysidea avara TaxID=196820 RepID=UPI0033343A9E
MKRAMKEGQFEAQRCFVHTLQLVVNDGVLSQHAVIDTLAVCRSIVGHFKHSTIAYHKLDQIRERLDIKKHKFQQDKPTRWNSTLYMLQTVYEQKMALAAYATEHGGITMLTPNQIDLTKKIIAVLEPVEEITKMISKDSASISMLIPSVKILEKAFNKHDDDSGIQTMKGEMLKSLETRFDDIEESELLLIATCLDSIFKDKFFSREAKRLASKCVIDNAVDPDVEVEPQSKRPRTESSTDSSVDNTSTSEVWECFTEILHDSGATTDTDGGKEAMVDRYLSEPLIDYKTGNPYTLWNNNKLRYPLLAKLAKRYLCSPPTSVPSERLFSGAGIL